MPNLTTNHTLAENADSLADYLPNGPLWAAKKRDSTTLRTLLESMAILLNDTEQRLNLVASEYDIRTTNSLIEEWESFVGIPDECFDIADTIEERRANVLLKLSGLGLQTELEYIALAQVFGQIITIDNSGSTSAFPYTLPITFGDFPAGFTIRIVSTPITVDSVLNSGGNALFNFTPSTTPGALGPTVFVGQTLNLGNFSESTYNVTGTVATADSSSFTLEGVVFAGADSGTFAPVLSDGLQCLYRILRPANVAILFVATP